MVVALSEGPRSKVKSYNGWVENTVTNDRFIGLGHDIGLAAETQVICTKSTGVHIQFFGHEDSNLAT